MLNTPFNPWWYYEMGQRDAQRSRVLRTKLTTKQKITFGFGLVLFWLFVTPVLAFGLWVIASIFGGLDFWICLIICGVIAFWLCSVVAK